MEKYLKECVGKRDHWNYEDNEAGVNLSGNDIISQTKLSSSFPVILFCVGSLLLVHGYYVVGCLPCFVSKPCVFMGALFAIGLG